MPNGTHDAADVLNPHQKFRRWLNLFTPQWEWMWVSGELIGGQDEAAVDSIAHVRLFSTMQRCDSDKYTLLYH